MFSGNGIWEIVELINKQEEIKKILPDLLLDYNSRDEEQEVELMTGFKGLQEIFREQVEIMNTGEVVNAKNNDRKNIAAHKVNMAFLLIFNCSWLINLFVNI